MGVWKHWVLTLASGCFRAHEHIGWPWIHRFLVGPTGDPPVAGPPNLAGAIVGPLHAPGTQNERFPIFVPGPRRLISEFEKWGF